MNGKTKASLIMLCCVTVTLVVAIIATTLGWYQTASDSDQTFEVTAGGQLFIYIASTTEIAETPLVPAKAMPYAVTNGLNVNVTEAYDPASANPSYVETPATISRYVSEFVYYYDVLIPELDIEGNPVYEHERNDYEEIALYDVTFANSPELFYAMDDTGGTPVYTHATDAAVTVYARAVDEEGYAIVNSAQNSFVYVPVCADANGTPVDYSQNLESTASLFVQEVDDSGNLVEEEGNPVYHKLQKAKLLQEMDAENNPVFDSFGNPIYVRSMVPQPMHVSYLLKFKNTNQFDAEGDEYYYDTSEFVVDSFCFSKTAEVDAETGMPAPNNVIPFEEDSQPSHNRSGSVILKGSQQVYIHFRVHLAKVDELVDPTLLGNTIYFEIAIQAYGVSGGV